MPLMESPTTFEVTVLEQCRVFPPPDTVAEKSLPLTFFDLTWLSFPPPSSVLFYDFPYSTTYFTQTLVPLLKTSLSLTLKHFFPLAGNLIIPSDVVNSNAHPQIRYSKGDSVSVTIVECNADFYHLSGYHARHADILSPLVPHLPLAATTFIGGEDYSVAPVFAVQVTLFPNHGISFGFTTSHVLADGSSFYTSRRTWASISKQLMINSEQDKVLVDDFPSYDTRSLIKDPMDLSTMWRTVHKPQNVGDVDGLAVTRSIQHRATFVIKQAAIQKLKDLVMSKNPTLPYVSSFTVTCAYVWSCMAKVRAAAGEEYLNDDEPLNFGFAVNCRAHLDPPLPASYFGNCLLPCTTREKRNVLAREEGFLSAAELIGKALFAKLKGGVVKGADKLSENELAGMLRGEWALFVSGSPQFDYYNGVDFGLGKPRKFECVTEPFSISSVKDSKTDLELGFIMSKTEMDLFSSIFSQGLPHSA